MIKFCICGNKETVQPYQDSRWIKGACSACRAKAMKTRRTVPIPREEAVVKVQSFLSKIRVR